MLSVITSQWRWYDVIWRHVPAGYPPFANYRNWIIFEFTEYHRQLQQLQTIYCNLNFVSFVFYYPAVFILRPVNFLIQFSTYRDSCHTSSNKRLWSNKCNVIFLFASVGGDPLAQSVKYWPPGLVVPGSSPVWGEDLFNRKRGSLHTAFH